MRTILIILISIILFSCNKDAEVKLTDQELEEIRQKGEEFENSLRRGLNVEVKQGK